ncbi:MAG: amidohydrolase family protein [Gemmatimonadota bacterium]
MREVDTLVRAGTLVTMDEAETVIPDAAVAISGGEIVGVGPEAEISGRFRGKEEIGGSDRIAMPGLINAHVHMADSLFRGLVEDLPLKPWLERLWVAERRFVSEESVRLGADLALAEMIRGGITTALDMFWFPESGALAAREAGFRLITGPLYFDFDAPDGLAADVRTERGREWLERWAHDPLIVPCVQPHNAMTVSPEYMREARALADEFGVLFHTHCAETAAEVASTRERFGTTPVGHLASLGVLDDRTALAHCIHLTDEDVDTLAGSGAAAIHNPLSNLKLGSGIMPLGKLRIAGVPVLLGTDGPVSGNDLDMWTAMRFAGLLQRGVHRDPDLTPSVDTLRMVTRDAARSLGLGALTGSIEAGKRADIILLETERPHLLPRYDVFAHLAYTVGRDDVATVLIDGRTVMRDRELLTLDERAAMDGVRALAEGVASFMAGADVGPTG